MGAAVIVFSSSITVLSNPIMTKRIMDIPNIIAPLFLERFSSSDDSLFALLITCFFAREGILIEENFDSTFLRNQLTKIYATANHRGKLLNRVRQTTLLTS